MTRLFLASALALLIFPSAQAQSDVIITGVIDADLGGGLPKAVELYIVSNGTDLSTYALGVANNGGGTDDVEQLLTGTYDAGDFVYVADDGTVTNDGQVRFMEFFGFDADIYGDFAVNGDDAVELFYDATGAFSGAEVVVDVFGEISVDGTNEPWEYTNGWAYRVSGTGQDGTTFVLGNWAFSGPDGLENDLTNAAAATPFPIGTYVNSGAEIFD
ncbi:MAG: nuclease, partial [Bacteroidota bacterium]